MRGLARASAYRLPLLSSSRITAFSIPETVKALSQDWDQICGKELADLRDIMDPGDFESECAKMLATNNGSFGWERLASLVKLGLSRERLPGAWEKSLSDKEGTALAEAMAQIAHQKSKYTAQ